jgi:hypothetical protein
VDEPGIHALRRTTQPLPEAQCAIEEVRDFVREAANLDVPFDLMRGEIVAAQDEERPASERVEERSRETVDVNRRSLTRRKTVERSVDRSVTDEDGWYTIGWRLAVGG